MKSPRLRLSSVVTAVVLDDGESEGWAMAVLLLEQHWRRRHALAPFYSLGLAAYLDADGPGARYRRQDLLEQSNALIRRSFLALLNAAAGALEELLHAPMRLAHRFAALPGFHIYLPHPAFADPVASVHRDLQYRQVFPGREPQAGEAFSFTLPLSHPSGSGLLLWPGCVDEVRRCAPDGRPVEPEFHAYRPGEIVLHDGLEVHQAVLGCDGITPRISLQGHGLWVDGTYLLYW